MPNAARAIAWSTYCLLTVSTATVDGSTLVRTALSVTAVELTGTCQYSRVTVPSLRWYTAV